MSHDLNAAVVAMQRTFEFAENAFKGELQSALSQPSKHRGFVYTLRHGSPDFFCQRSHVIGELVGGNLYMQRKATVDMIEHTLVAGFATSLMCSTHWAGAYVAAPWCGAITGLSDFDNHCLAIALGSATGRGYFGSDGSDRLEMYVGEEHMSRYKRVLDALPVFGGEGTETDESLEFLNA